MLTDHVCPVFPSTVSDVYTGTCESKIKMKDILNIALAASLAAGAAAQPHNHQHLHRRQHQHEVEKRELVVEYAQETATTYVMVNTGESVSNDDAEEGLADGIYKIVGESTPTLTTPTPTPSSTKVSSTSSATSSSSKGAEFLELKLGLGATTTSASSTSTSSTSSAAASTSTSSSSSSSSSGGSGVDRDFPDGEISCDEFPSDYGAVCISNAGLDCWAGLEDVGVASYVLGQTSDIVDFSVAISGGASKGMFAAYACPTGYDMAQWPDAQGATGQSIGGLWCGSDNKLYKTRGDGYSKLCQKGAGNVHVKNKLSDEVYFCKTLYPSTEAMVLPTCASPGETTELFNPYQNSSFTWNGGSTSAQIYVNLKGIGIDNSCVWDSPDPYADNAGNWAGIILGTSVDDNGITYLSLFHNTPTSSTPLDYNIEVAVDGSVDCKYEYSSNEITGDSDGKNGCTVSLPLILMAGYLVLVDCI